MNKNSFFLFLINIFSILPFSAHAFLWSGASHPLVIEDHSEGTNLLNAIEALSPEFQELFFRRFEIESLDRVTFDFTGAINKDLFTVLMEFSPFEVHEEIKQIRIIGARLTPHSLGRLAKIFPSVDFLRFEDCIFSLSSTRINVLKETIEKYSSRLNDFADLKSITLSQTYFEKNEELAGFFENDNNPEKISFENPNEFSLRVKNLFHFFYYPPGITDLKVFLISSDLPSGTLLIFGS